MGKEISVYQVIELLPSAMTLDELPEDDAEAAAAVKLATCPSLTVTLDGAVEIVGATAAPTTVSRAGVLVMLFAGLVATTE